MHNLPLRRPGLACKWHTLVTYSFVNCESCRPLKACLPQSLFLRFWWSYLTLCSQGQSSVARYPPFCFSTCKKRFSCRALVLELPSCLIWTNVIESHSYRWPSDGLGVFAYRSTASGSVGLCHVKSLRPCNQVKVSSSAQLKTTVCVIVVSN